MNKLIQNGLFFKDKIVTAKHTIVGEDLERSILKATTDEIALPKKKYIDYLVICTRDETISILEMSKGIMDRVHNPNWVVAFKALLVVHELMNYSNERFFQYMASDSSSLKLDTFSDRKDASSLFMSQMVRLYSHYISVKAVSFRVVGYDFCKVKRGGKDGFFKTLDSKKLFSSLSQLHNQLDVLLAFKPNLDELRNCVAVEGYKMAFKDLVRLVACLNDANANLLEHFADYNRKDCQQALILYKKFPLYIKRVTKHYELAESFSFEPVQLPSLNQVPQDLQSMMEEQLKNMENNTKTTISPSALPKPASRPPNSRRMSMPVSALPLSNTPSLFTQPSTCTQTSTSTNVSSPALTSLSLEKLSFDDNFKELTLNGVSYKEREKALLEEQKVLQEFKAKKEEASRRELVQTNNNTNNNNNNKISNNANNTFNNNNSFSNSNSSFNNYNIFDTNTAFDSAFNNFNNNDNNSFASFDATSITSINTIPILTPQPSVGSPLSSSLPPEFLDENMFQSPKERKSSSPSTPLQLDFSKVSLPPSNSMHPYNQMYPISPTHFSPGAFLPSNVPLNNYNWQQGNQTTQNPFF